MSQERMAEGAIDARLDAYIHGAREGNIDQARHLHEMLDQMLIEREAPQGRLWLTRHGRDLLAEMHRHLSHCRGSGEELQHHVMEAVELNPRRGKWEGTPGYVLDLRVAIAVANQLCEQRSAGVRPDLEKAVQAVADSGEFDLNSHRIRELYDDIASTVGGFSKFQE